MTSETATIDPNQHVKQYLKHYVSFAHPPRFAVMINGPWGAGKTHLVRAYLNKLESESTGKPLHAYVSLYGVSSIDEMDSAVLAALYPMISGKKTQFAIGLLRSWLKTSIGTDDKTNLSSLMNQDPKRLFVFDDLERCQLRVDEVLGYINPFVEHDGCKVILISNEAEIEHKDDYRRCREKLIGKTLAVEASFDEALDEFILKIDNATARNLVNEKRGVIREMFQQSELHNLRILQQTLWDLERFLEVLTPKHLDCKSAVDDAIRMFLAFSFEVKSGRLCLANIDLWDHWIARAVAGGEGSVPDEFEVAQKRYPNARMEQGQRLLSEKALVGMLDRGIFDEVEIRRSLDESHYYRQADEPAWKTVWHGLSRTDKEFSEALSRLDRQIEEQSLTTPGEMLHVFGIRLWLSGIGVLAKTRTEVVEEAQTYIDALYNNQRLAPLDVRVRHSYHDDAYDGLGVNQSNTPEYQLIRDYLEQKRREAGRDGYPQIASELMGLIASDPELFLRRICMTNSEDNLYYDVPVLASLSASAFVDSLVAQHPAHQLTVMQAIRYRYDKGQLDRELESERSWLRDVKRCLDKAAAKMQAFPRYRTEGFLRWYSEPSADLVKSTED